MEITCKTCADLIGAYQRSVQRYTEAVHHICGTVDDDFKSALAKAEKLRLTCLVANQVMLDHWHNEHHPGPALCGAKRVRRSRRVQRAN